MRDYRDELMCELVSCVYDYEAKCARLTIDGLGCTDMTGAIRYAERIDAEVCRIETYNEQGWDTVYQREGEGWWAVSRRGCRNVWWPRGLFNGDRS